MANERRQLALFAGAALASALVACSDSSFESVTDPDGPFVGVDTQEAMIDLGFRIMFDERLSRPHGVACGTCHDPFLGWGDSRPQGKGVQDNSLSGVGHEGTIAVEGARFKTILTPRNTPTIYNSHLFTNLFWDGRALDLGHQAQFPFEAGPEMNSSWDEHILPIMQDDTEYQGLFEAAFGPGAEHINQVNASLAVGAYEATITVFDTPYDAFLAGDAGALTPQQQEGHDLFFGKADCGRCHPAPFLTDFSFHNTGVPEAGVNALNGVVDLGFGQRTDLELIGTQEGGTEIAVDEPENYAKFKTPQLRMVSVTGPYMHNGALLTLEDVVDFYDAGGGPDLTIPILGAGNGTKDPDLAPLGLTASERAALVAFLEVALTGTEIR